MSLKHDAPFSASYNHNDWMKQALEQAENALYLSDPNPRVGCVLVNQEGLRIGAGFTQAVGNPHAEVMALRNAKDNGFSTQGATAFVTLEPCSHHGRTPPCADALVDAGIEEVVIGALDPNPQVCGNGIKRLEQAGIKVTSGILAHESEELNIGFFKRMKTDMPWVRLKMACSLDGKTALLNGKSQWITGEAARADGHAFRARASAVLTGIGTVLADNPQLNVRAVNVHRQPWHIVLDAQLQTPANAALLKNQGKKLIYTANSDISAQQPLAHEGAFICMSPLTSNDHLDLAYILRDLAQYHECNELHIEAGSTLSSAFLQAGLVDELLIYIAPRLIGKGMDLLTGVTLESLEQTLDFHFTDTQLMGQDLRLRLRR